MAKPTTICTVRVGSFAVPVTQYADGRYFAGISGIGTERIKITSKDLEKVRAETERVLCKIIEGETEAGQITAQEARIYLAAAKPLKEHGIEVDQAARLVAELARILGDPHRALEASRNFLAASGEKNATVLEIYELFIRVKKTALANGDIGEERIEDLEGDLKSFLELFGAREIRKVMSLEIQDYLNAIKGRWGKKIGARRRRNLRDAVICFFNYARANNFLPFDRSTEAEKTVRPKVRRGRQPTFTPGEIRIILAAATTAGPGDRPVDLLPYLAIQAFAGLRGSEIRRLHWETSILWDQKSIRLTDEEADKTGNARPVEMRDNLLTWLAPYRGRRGPIVDPEIERMDNYVRRLCQRVGLKWKNNVLRHSFGSYLCALTSNVGFVAMQMGNDEKTCRKDYLEYKSAEEGKAWFAVDRKEEESNVIQLPLSWAQS